MKKIIGFIVFLITVLVFTPVYAEMWVGKDLSHLNLVGGPPPHIEGNSIIFHGGDIGFEISKYHRGKNKRIRFNIEIIEGSAQMGLDKYGVGLIEETQWVSSPASGIFSRTWFIPNETNLFAVIRAAPNSTVKILYGRID